MLLGGSYPDATLAASRATAAAHVSVKAASAGAASIGRVTSESPFLDWSGIRITTSFMLNRGAHDSTMTSMHFDGGGLFLRTAGATIHNSLFENGSSLDGIQVGGATNALIEGNTVRDYDQARDNGLHADCIQVFESRGVTIRGNRLGNCYNAGIIISAGGGGGSNGITIESNFIQGCVQRSAACAGGSAIDAREPSAVNVALRSNTIVNGSTRLVALPGLVVDRNIIEYLANCDAPLSNSIIGSWNTALCRVPTYLGVQGNRAGTVRFVNQPAGDLHLVSGSEAVIARWGSPAIASRDIDGQSINPALAGADSVATSSSPVPPATDKTPPSVSITSPANGATVSGVVSLRASATDDTGVTGVSFLLGSTVIGPGTRQSDGTWTLTSDTRMVAPGTYAVTARATDAAGNVGTSAPVAVRATR